MKPVVDIAKSYQISLALHLAVDRKSTEPEVALGAAKDAAINELQSDLGRDLSLAELHRLNKLTAGVLTALEQKPQREAQAVKSAMAAEHGPGLEEGVAGRLSTAVQAAEEVGSLGMDPAGLAETYLAVSNEMRSSLSQGLFGRIAGKLDDTAEKVGTPPLIGILPAAAFGGLAMLSFGVHLGHIGLARLLGAPKGALSPRITSQELETVAHRFRGGTDAEKACIGQFADEALSRFDTFDTSSLSRTTDFDDRPYLSDNAKSMLQQISDETSQLPKAVRQQSRLTVDLFNDMVRVGRVSPEVGVRHLRRMMGEAPAALRDDLSTAMHSVAEATWPTATRVLLESAILHDDSPEGRLEGLSAEVDLYQRQGFLLSRKISGSEVDALIESVGRLPADEQASAGQALEAKLFTSDGEARRGYKFDDPAIQFKLNTALSRHSGA